MYEPVEDFVKKLLPDGIQLEPASKAVKAVLIFTLLLASGASSAFGQAGCAQPDPTPATDPLHTIVPVHLDASNGNITVGTTTYCGQNPGFHILALSRQPDPKHLDAPDLILDQTYTDAASVTGALKQVLNTLGGPVVIINAVGNYGIALSDVAQALASFGAGSDLRPINAAIPFIFVGNGGRKQQTALQRGYSTRNLDGYLAQDSNSNYAFLQMDFLRYDINLDGSITVGQNTYSVADSYKVDGCGGQNAFHLVKVDRETADAALVNNTYCTAQSDSEIQRLIGDLNLITSNFADESGLIFLASNGHPIPANWNFGTDGDARIYPLAQQVAKLGGYWETMVYLTPSDTYSLVGAPPPPAGIPQSRQRARESSTVYPASPIGKAPTGELHGVLQRGRGNWYSPLNADPSGSANLELYRIMAQPPVPYPSFTGDQLTAFQYINQKLCGTGNCLRGSYSNVTVDPLSFANALTNLSDANNNSCNDLNSGNLPFCQVRAQLLPEIRYAANVHTFYDNVYKLWDSKQSVTLSSQLGVYDDVRATLPQAAGSASAPSLVSPLVNLFLGLASNIPAIGPAFGVVDLFFNFGNALATDPQGNQTIDLTSTIGELETQAGEQFIAEGQATARFFQLITEDGGKLNAVGSALASGSSPWYWTFDTNTQMLAQMLPAIRQSAYQSIMPAAYAVGFYVPQSSLSCYGNGPSPVWGETPLWEQPRSYVVLDTDYTCGNAGNTPAVQPFAPPCCTVYLPYTYPNDPGNPNASDPRTGTILADGGWLGISLISSKSNSGGNTYYDPPGLSLLTKLFTPLSQSGLGAYRPAFFEGWPFPRVTCDPSYGVGVGNGRAIGGCDWGAGTLLTEPVTPGPLVANISLRAIRISTDGTQANVRVTVHNSGNATANSVQINSILLNTLGGSGKASLVSPALPIQVSSLAPGDSTNVILKIDIPPGLSKFSITEQGWADVGQPQSTWLSEVQVLYPQQ